MSRKLEIAGNILAELLNYALVMALQMILFLDFAGYWPGNIRIFLPALLPVLFYLLREFGGSRILFFGLHIFFPWAMIALWGRNIYEKLIFGVSAILFSLFSIHRRLTKEDRGSEVIFPLAASVFFFLFYLLDNYQSGGNTVYLIRFMIWYALIYFLHLYLMHFRRYMDINHRTTENIPVNRAFYSSFSLVAGFLVISAAAICLGANGEILEAVWAVLKKWLLAALSFLISLLPRGGESVVQEIEQTVQESGGMMMLPMEETEPSLLSKLLEGVFFLLGAAAAAAFFGAAFLAFFRLVNAAFAGKEKKAGEREDSETDRVEKLDRSPKEKKKHRSGISLFAARTPQQMIRRLYFVSLRRKYYIKREEKTEKLLGQGTARECCSKLFPEKEQISGDFAELYEKARYGRESCSKEDVRRMKQLSGELLK